MYRRRVSAYRVKYRESNLIRASSVARNPRKLKVLEVFKYIQMRTTSSHVYVRYVYDYNVSIRTY